MFKRIFSRTERQRSEDEEHQPLLESFTIEKLSSNPSKMSGSQSAVAQVELQDLPPPNPPAVELQDLPNPNIPTVQPGDAPAPDASISEAENLFHSSNPFAELATSTCRENQNIDLLWMDEAEIRAWILKYGLSGVGGVDITIQKKEKIANRWQGTGILYTPLEDLKNIFGCTFGEIISQKRDQTIGGRGSYRITHVVENNHILPILNEISDKLTQLEGKKISKRRRVAIVVSDSLFYLHGIIVSVLIFKFEGLGNKFFWQKVAGHVSVALILISIRVLLVFSLADLKSRKKAVTPVTEA